MMDNFIDYCKLYGIASHRAKRILYVKMKTELDRIRKRLNSPERYAKIEQLLVTKTWIKMEAEDQRLLGNFSSAERNTRRL